MEKVINLVNFGGWVYIMFSVGLQLFLDPVGFQSINIEMDVWALRAVQTFQVLDIILILIGVTKGSIFGAVSQILGRMIVAWAFITPET